MTMTSDIRGLFHKFAELSSPNFILSIISHETICTSNLSYILVFYKIGFIVV